jgi:hypothetical protein
MEFVSHRPTNPKGIGFAVVLVYSTLRIVFEIQYLREPARD